MIHKTLLNQKYSQENANMLRSTFDWCDSFYIPRIMKQNHAHPSRRNKNLYIQHSQTHETSISIVLLSKHIIIGLGLSYPLLELVT